MEDNVFSFESEDSATEFQFGIITALREGEEIEWRRSRWAIPGSRFKISDILLETVEGEPDYRTSASEPEGWLVVDVKMGPIHQMPAPMPYSLLREALRNRRVIFDLMWPEIGASIVLKNCSAQERRVRAKFLGKTV